jgi:hypothetical protein
MIREAPGLSRRDKPAGSSGIAILAKPQAAGSGSNLSKY